MDKVIHDMKQYAFTKRKLECSIKMGNFLEKAYVIRKKGLIIWYLCGPLGVFFALRRLMRELEIMSQEVTNGR